MVNNLDHYYLFLLEDYRDLSVLFAFFTVFFDYKNYANQGEIVISKKKVEFNYTFDKNNKYYDKDWIKKHFDSQAVLTIKKEIAQERKKALKSIKKTFLFLLILILFVFALFLAVFLFFFNA